MVIHRVIMVGVFHSGFVLDVQHIYCRGLPGTTRFIIFSKNFLVQRHGTWLMFAVDLRLGSLAVQAVETWFGRLLPIKREGERSIDVNRITSSRHFWVEPEVLGSSAVSKIG